MTRRQVPLGLAAILLLLAAPVSRAEFGNVVFEKDSLYQRIIVYRDGNIVTLRFGRSPVL